MVFRKNRFVILILSVILFLGCTGEETTTITPASTETPPKTSTPLPPTVTPAPTTLQPTSKQISLESEVIYYEPYPLAFYNAFYQMNIPSITFEIFNPMDNPLTVKLTSEYQGVSYPSITTKTVEPGEWETINQTIQLKRDEISKIKTKTKLSLLYKIEYEDNGDWKIWDEQTVQIDAYPMDTMVWAIKDENGNEIPLYGYIATFVTPKSDAVRELLAVAKEYHPERSLAGYQCGGCSDEEWIVYTAQQVKAIYDALQDYYGVSYVNTPTAFGKDAVQKVNLPKDSLRLSSANCIDGVVVFASAIEALGMRPYIVIIPGHAFVAWDVKGDGSLIDALETTMVGSASFEEAWEMGNKQLEQYWDELFDEDPWNGIVIDITEARKIGILPME